MAEAQARFLCKITSMLSSGNETHTLLRSHYLMKCKKITRGNNLPEKLFSSSTRCTHCCLEWKKEAEVNLKPIKLTKRQRYRIKRLKHSKIEQYNKRKVMLHGNKMEQICSFCGYNTITFLKKPDKLLSNIKHAENEDNLSKENINNNSTILKTKTKDKKVIGIQNNYSKIKNSLEINLYSNTHDVFALNNKGNTLPNKIKESPKVIKNSKRKKDKYAGLCKKAVLASAKLIEEQQKQNKLNLFLKPST